MGGQPTFFFLELAVLQDMGIAGLRSTFSIVEFALQNKMMPFHNRAIPCSEVAPKCLITCYFNANKGLRVKAPRRTGRIAPNSTQERIILRRLQPFVPRAATEPAPATAPLRPAWKWEESSDSQRAHAVFLAVLGLGALPATQSIPWFDLPYFISLAVCTIYLGAHRGLTSPKQQISFREGALAPVAASVAILAAYCLVKYFPDLSLQGLFDAYFWLLGTVAITGAFAAPARTAASKLALPTWRVPLPTWLGATDEADTPVDSADASPTDLAVALVAICLASWDLTSHHSIYTLNNLVACCVAADILQLLGLRSFRVAAVLLFGLLAYDVFWVFGSPGVIGDNVMLAVATSDVLTGPTRLLFPRVAGSVGEASSFPFSLLGLGDVAVPGLLACLALRFDASRSVDMRGRAEAAAAAIWDAIGSLRPDASGDDVSRTTGDAAIAAYERIADREDAQRSRTLSGSRREDDSVAGTDRTIYPASDAVMEQRTYFLPVMIAYVAGLSMAFAANYITHMGQPALLYLVPCTVGAVAAVATARGDWPKVLAFTDTSKGLEGGGGKQKGEEGGKE